MKKYKAIKFIMLLVIISILIVFGFKIYQKQNSLNKSLTNINANTIYYLEGQGDKWEFNYGVLIIDSNKCFFANGILKNKSSEKITLKNYISLIEERNVKNEVVSYLHGRSVEYGLKQNIEPYRTIKIFEGLTPKQYPEYCEDIKNNNLFLIFEYKDLLDNKMHKEEIKLNKQLFSWN